MHLVSASDFGLYRNVFVFISNRNVFMFLSLALIKETLGVDAHGNSNLLVLNVFIWQLSCW